MNKFFEFNELYEKANDFYKREASIIALDYINSALELDIFIFPKRKFEAVVLRGLIKAKLGKYTGSISDFNKAIELDPEDPIPFYNRGLSLLNIEQYKSSFKDFDRAIELDPEDPIPFYNRGLAKVILKQYEDALSDINKAITLDEDPDGKYYDLRGQAEYSLGNYKKAIFCFNQAEKLYDIYKDQTFLRLRGLSYKALGKKELAIKDFKQAFSLGDKASKSLLKSINK